MKSIQQSPPSSVELAPCKKTSRRGIWSALASAFFLGLAPIFGKQAILLGISPFTVVALRTIFAALLLLILVVIFKRQYLFIYPAGLLGCGLAGAINGLGSILYYLSLERLSVSMGQLLYSLYPVFLVIWFICDKQKISLLTYIRLAISIGGIILLTTTGNNHADWLGIILMLGASALYALHLPINQKILLDIPAPTVTLYTLLSMSIVTVPTFFIFTKSLPLTLGNWEPVIFLTLVTFLSRLTLFQGIKKLGGTQTALLGISELLVTIVVGQIWFRDSLLPFQWVGAILLLSSIALISIDRIAPEKTHGRDGILGWLSPPDIRSRIPWGLDN